MDRSRSLCSFAASGVAGLALSATAWRKEWVVFVHQAAAPIGTPASERQGGSYQELHAAAQRRICFRTSPRAKRRVGTWLQGSGGGDVSGRTGFWRTLSELKCPWPVTSTMRVVSQGAPAVVVALVTLWLGLKSRSALTSFLASFVGLLNTCAPLRGIVLMFPVLLISVMLQRQVERDGTREQRRLSDKDIKRTTFADFAGAEKAKAEVWETVEILNNPGLYATFGARVPCGLLLVGPPGTGKTLLARACAAEAHLPFISVAATEFVELFVGRGAARVRQLFDRARQLAPCIVFVDEIDAIGCSRSSPTEALSGSNEAEQTLNQLLASMDGLSTRDANRPVVVIAATNRPEVLDEALLRPGRFDRVVRVEMPDADGRLEIILTHVRLKQVPLAPDTAKGALANFARRCDGLGGAAIEAVVNEAAIRAARRHLHMQSLRKLEAIVSDEPVRKDTPPEVSIADFEAALTEYITSRSGLS